VFKIMFSYITTLFGSAKSRQGTRQLEFGGAHRISLILLIIVGLLGFKELPYPGVLVCILLGVTSYEFVKRMDQGLPLMQVAAVLAVLQWVVGPWLTYNVDFFFSTYIMRVESFTYFAYAIPGTAAFVVGLLSVGVGARQRGLLSKADRSQFVVIGLILATLGFAGGLAEKLLPGGGLTFVFYLMSQLRYVAALYFLFSGSPLRYPLAGMSLLPLLTGSAESGMFHDLMLWMGIVGCYWYAMKKHQIWLTVIFLIIGFAAGFTLQGIKKGYRDKLRNDDKVSMMDEAKDFLANRNSMFGEENLSNAIIRINQGWIVAAIMQNVPSSEPYAMGDTLGEALSAALIPRVIDSDKTKAGGQVNFRRFTGLPLWDDTSMGLSLLGEAYANVGPEWGIALMLLFGGGMSLVYALCLSWSVTHPTFYFWIPVIFCQTIKAETDLVTVLNHITKGSIVVFGLYWIICIQFLPTANARKTAGRRILPRPASRFGKRRLAEKLRVES
jgi:hypothetical protein